MAQNENAFKLTPLARAILATIIFLSLQSFVYIRYPETSERSRITDFESVLDERSFSRPQDIVYVDISSASRDKIGGSVNLERQRREEIKLIDYFAKEKAKLLVLYLRLSDPSPPVDNELAASIGSLPTFLIVGKQPDPTGKTGEGAPDWKPFIPLPIFQNKAQGIGSFSIGGVAFREFPTERDVGGKIYRPLYRAVSDYLQLHSPSKSIRSYLNYYKWPEDLSGISSDRILDGQMAEGFFKDKIVILSAHSIVSDTDAMPGNPANPPGGALAPYALEIHASLINNVMDSSYLRRLPFGYENLFLLGILGIVVFSIWLLTPVRGTLFAVICYLGQNLASRILASYFILLPRANAIDIYPLVILARLLFGLKDNLRNSLYNSSSLLRRIIVPKKLGGVGAAIELKFKPCNDGGAGDHDPIDAFLRFHEKASAIIHSYDGAVLPAPENFLVAVWGAQSKIDRAAEKALLAAREVAKITEGDAVRIGLAFGDLTIRSFGKGSGSYQLSVGATQHEAARLSQIAEEENERIVIDSASHERIPKDKIKASELPTGGATEAVYSVKEGDL